MRVKYWILIIFLLSLLSCSDSEVTSTEVDYAKLDAAFNSAAQITNLRSLTVSVGGKIIKTGYFGGGGAENVHDVRSVTKSVTALLIGIAIDKGYISSTDARLGSYIDTALYNITPAKAEITIKDLLTMSSGLEWEELVSVNGYNNWISAPNQIQYVLDKPLVNTPGQVFAYNSGALHLLSYILTKATGKTTLQFATENLFIPLGIGTRGWLKDRQGYYNGAAGLSITPLDMIKIGNLILNRGVYNGNRLVSAEYMNQMLTAQIATNNAQPFTSGYGYGLWLGSNGGSAYTLANGYGGQFIVVVPAKQLVITATNQWSGISATEANNQWYQTLNLILTVILDAIK